MNHSFSFVFSFWIQSPSYASVNILASGRNMGDGASSMSLPPLLERTIVDDSEAVVPRQHAKSARGGTSHVRRTGSARFGARSQLAAALNDTIYTEADVETVVTMAVMDMIGFSDCAAITPASDITLDRVYDYGAASSLYNGIGFDIYNQFNPEATFFLNNIHADTRVPEMQVRMLMLLLLLIVWPALSHSICHTSHLDQGDVFQFPVTPNVAEDVVFELPEPPCYADPTDLYYMPILEMASLIKSGAVSCVEVVQAFVDRLTEFNPYLGIVATPLYDQALATAAAHDALLANGTYVGPLMCIPFG
jgi:hypothetical protein